MKLDQLIKNLRVEKIIGTLDLDITDVKIDSRSVCNGNLFVALKGVDSDGADYISQAETYGAVAVVTERELQTHLTQIIVKNARKELSNLAISFYKNKSKKIKLIGVIGTNGKTTVSHMIYNVLNNAGIKCGVIGTLGTFYLDKQVEQDLTTPDPLTLNKMLSDMYDEGVKVAVMEVSAHAIFWEKVYGLDFEVGIFTNLTRDHIDFFENMQNYKQAKLKFFNENKCKFIVCNTDDDMGIEISSKKQNVVTYGIDNPADVFAIEIKESKGKTSFVINLFDCIYNVKTNFIGKFNVSNALAATTTCALMGVKPNKVIEGIEKTKRVEGRLELIYENDFKVYIDYAHTPDGIEKSIKTLKSSCEGRLICVFGCGGNRDKGKREIMGEISSKYADFTIVTSDNPRFEEPMSIIREIEKGILRQGKNYVLIEDRVDAIEYALNIAKKGDAILIAGKGSEKYQEVLGVKKMYNDKETIIDLVGRRKSD